MAFFCTSISVNDVDSNYLNGFFSNGKCSAFWPRCYIGVQPLSHFLHVRQNESLVIGGNSFYGLSPEKLLHILRVAQKNVDKALLVVSEYLFVLFHRAANCFHNGYFSNSRTHICIGGIIALPDVLNVLLLITFVAFEKPVVLSAYFSKLI